MSIDRRTRTNRIIQITSMHAQFCHYGTQVLYTTWILLYSTYVSWNLWLHKPWNQAKMLLSSKKRLRQLLLWKSWTFQWKMYSLVDIYATFGTHSRRVQPYHFRFKLSKLARFFLREKKKKPIIFNEIFVSCVCATLFCVHIVLLQALG